MPTCLKGNQKTDDKNRKITAKKNAKMADAFAKIPYSERTILVPQCLRHPEKCKAQDKGSHYICIECGQCKIADISKKAKSLNYKAVYILKGGRVVEKLVRELKPKAILGVACFYEGVIGMEQAEKSGIVVQFHPLTKDGCVATDINLEEALKLIEKKID